MNINVNESRFGALTLNNTKRKGAADQGKFGQEMSDALSSGDMGQMMGAMMKMQMMQSMMGNPMMAPYMAKMMGMDASEATDKVDFSNARKNVMDNNKDYISEDGEVSDIETPAKALSSDERDQEKDKLSLNAPKESIALFEKNDAGMYDTENNLATKLQDAGYSDIISNNNVDFDGAAMKQKELEKETKGKIDHSTVKALMDGNNQNKDINQLIGEDGAGELPTQASRKQKQELEQLGIVKDGQIQEIKKGSEAEKYLTNLDKSYNNQELLEKVQDADVFVQTEKTDKDSKTATFTKADVNNAGDIEGAADADGQTVDASKGEKITAPGQAEGKEKIASPQLSIDGLDNEVVKKITTVNKKGEVEIDLTKSKLTPEQYAALETKGITYTGSAALKIKGRENGAAVKLNIAGDAKNVELQGGAFNVATTNDALKIKSDAKSTITNIEGDNLKHLVVDGGNVEAKMDGLKELEALKIQNAKVKELALNADGDLAVNLDNITTENDMAISAGEDAQIQIKNSKMKKLAVTAKEGDARVNLQGSTANDVTVKASDDHTAIFGGDYKTKADNIKLEGQKAIVNADGLEAKSIDASGVTDGAGVFLAKGTKITSKEGIKLNAATKDKNEIVLEDEKDKDLKKLAEGNKDNANIRGMSQDDVFKYLGWSESKFKQIQANEKAQYATYANPYSSSYGAPGGVAQKDDGWAKRGLKGFAMGTQMYNQMNGYGYQNQMMGYNQGYNQMGMGYQQQPYNWMQQGW